MSWRHKCEFIINLLITSPSPYSLEPLMDKQSTELSLAAPLTRTVHVQTDYRDSETQTDPYSPAYVVRPGSQPELLTLATLYYGEY